MVEVCGRGTTKRVARSEAACGEPFSGLGGVRPVECGLEQRYVALGLYSGQDHPHLTEVDLRFRVGGAFLRDEYVVPPPGLQANLMRTSARDRLGYPVDGPLQVGPPSSAVSPMVPSSGDGPVMMAAWAGCF